MDLNLPEATAVLAVTRFALAADGDNPFHERAVATLRAFGACPGYSRGSVARSMDSPDHWCLVTEWSSVGAYRRALSSYDVRIAAGTLFADALDEPSAYEVLTTVGGDGEVTSAGSDRADLR